MLSYTGNMLIMNDPEAVAQEAAQRVVCAAVRAVAEHGCFALAIPGGQTPRRMFELLTSVEYSGLMPWSKTHVFFTDERCVPPDHKDSNYKCAHDLLLSKVTILQTNVHRFQTELCPDDAARAYDVEFRNVLGDYPALDMIILGMGEDSHTASLFPGTHALEEQSKFAAANYIEKLGEFRLTLTYPAINSACEVMIIAAGFAKADALKDAIQADPDSNLRPIQGVCPTFGKLLWIVDREAASKF